MRKNPKKSSLLVPVKTHDAFFKAVGSIKEVAEELVRFGLPKDIYETLSIHTLKLAPTSFIDKQLRESLSDLVYFCQAKSDKPIRICFIFEHKSQHPGNALAFQLLRYILNILELEEKQKQKHLALTIPIVFYHGKETWNPKTLLDLYADLPETYWPFVPNFQFCIINLQSMGDGQIMALNDFKLARNIFLAMKHAWEDDFYRDNFGKLVIFGTENVRPEIQELLIRLFFEYITHVSSLNTQELMESVQSLPPKQRKKVKTTWDNLQEHFEKIGLERGMQKGLEKGMEQGVILGFDKMIMVLQYLREFPTSTDLEIANKFTLPVERIQELRKTLQMKQ